MNQAQSQYRNRNRIYTQNNEIVSPNVKNKGKSKSKQKLNLNGIKIAQKNQLQQDNNSKCYQNKGVPFKIKKNVSKRFNKMLTLIGFTIQSADKAIKYIPKYNHLQANFSAKLYYSDRQNLLNWLNGFTSSKLNNIKFQDWLQKNQQQIQKKLYLTNKYFKTQNPLYKNQTNLSDSNVQKIKRQLVTLKKQVEQLKNLRKQQKINIKKYQTQYPDNTQTFINCSQNFCPKCCFCKRSNYHSLHKSQQTEQSQFTIQQQQSIKKEHKKNNRNKSQPVVILSKQPSTHNKINFNKYRTNMNYNSGELLGQIEQDLMIQNRLKTQVILKLIEIIGRYCPTQIGLLAKIQQYTSLILNSTKSKQSILENETSKHQISDSQQRIRYLQEQLFNQDKKTHNNNQQNQQDHQSQNNIIQKLQQLKSKQKQIDHRLIQQKRAQYVLKIKKDVQQLVEKQGSTSLTQINQRISQNNQMPLQNNKALPQNNKMQVQCIEFINSNIKNQDKDINQNKNQFQLLSTFFQQYNNNFRQLLQVKDKYKNVQVQLRQTMSQNQIIQRKLKTLNHQLQDQKQSFERQSTIKANNLKSFFSILKSTILNWGECKIQIIKKLQDPLIQFNQKIILMVQQIQKILNQNKKYQFDIKNKTKKQNKIHTLKNKELQFNKTSSNLSRLSDSELQSQNLSNLKNELMAKDQALIELSQIIEQKQSQIQKLKIHLQRQQAKINGIQSQLISVINSKKIMQHMVEEQLEKYEIQCIKLTQQLNHRNQFIKQLEAQTQQIQAQLKYQRQNKSKTSNAIEQYSTKLDKYERDRQTLLNFVNRLQEKEKWTQQNLQQKQKQILHLQSQLRKAQSLNFNLEEQHQFDRRKTEDNITSKKIISSQKQAIQRLELQNQDLSEKNNQNYLQNLLNFKKQIQSLKSKIDEMKMQHKNKPQKSISQIKRCTLNSKQADQNIGFKIQIQKQSPNTQKSITYFKEVKNQIQNLQSNKDFTTQIQKTIIPSQINRDAQNSQFFEKEDQLNTNLTKNIGKIKKQLVQLQAMIEQGQQSNKPLEDEQIIITQENQQNLQPTLLNIDIGSQHSINQNQQTQEKSVNEYVNEGDLIKIKDHLRENNKQKQLLVRKQLQIVQLKEEIASIALQNSKLKEELAYLQTGYNKNIEILNNLISSIQLPENTQNSQNYHKQIVQLKSKMQNLKDSEQQKSKLILKFWQILQKQMIPRLRQVNQLKQSLKQCQIKLSDKFSMQRHQNDRIITLQRQNKNKEQLIQQLNDQIKLLNNKLGQSSQNLQLIIQQLQNRQKQSLINNENIYKKKEFKEQLWSSKNNQIESKEHLSENNINQNKQLQQKVHEQNEFQQTTSLKNGKHFNSDQNLKEQTAQKGNNIIIYKLEKQIGQLKSQLFEQKQIHQILSEKNEQLQLQIKNQRQNLLIWITQIQKIKAKLKQEVQQKQQLNKQHIGEKQAIEQLFKELYERVNQMTIIIQEKTKMCQQLQQLSEQKQSNTSKYLQQQSYEQVKNNMKLNQQNGSEGYFSNTQFKRIKQSQISDKFQQNQKSLFKILNRHRIQILSLHDELRQNRKDVYDNLNSRSFNLSQKKDKQIVKEGEKANKIISSNKKSDKQQSKQQKQVESQYDQFRQESQIQKIKKQTQDLRFVLNNRQFAFNNIIIQKDRQIQSLKTNICEILKNIKKQNTKIGRSDSKDLLQTEKTQPCKEYQQQLRQLKTLQLETKLKQAQSQFKQLLQKYENQKQQIQHLKILWEQKQVQSELKYEKYRLSKKNQMKQQLEDDQQQVNSNQSVISEQNPNIVFQDLIKEKNQLIKSKQIENSPKNLKPLNKKAEYDQIRKIRQHKQTYLQQSFRQKARRSLSPNNQKIELQQIVPQFFGKKKQTQ